jgi:hypothetical protein
MTGGEGYSYTTISARPGQLPQIRVSLYLDDRAEISVLGLSTGPPHLHLSHGQATVNISTSSEGVTAQDTQVARALARSAAEYAAEVDRQWAAQQATDSDDGGQPGADPAA